MITVYIYRSASCHRSVFHCFEDWKMSQKCTISTLQAIKNAIMGWSWPIDVNRNHLTIQKLNFWVYGTWRNSCKQMLFDNGIKWLGSLCNGSKWDKGRVSGPGVRPLSYGPGSWIPLVICRKCLVLLVSYVKLWPDYTSHIIKLLCGGVKHYRVCYHVSI